ncbi:MAG: hypothetical protein ACTHNO_05925 [Ralstonia sp.]|uniref:hypothetical protein n=1 Tax=Ralstonia sp. TaxID=54061 RepID=UPI003F7F19D3
MNKTEQKDLGLKLEGKAPVVTALFAYWLFLAMCYLIAYWNQFGINVFELAGLTDFAKLAIYPIALTAVAAGGSIVISASSAMFFKSTEEWGRHLSPRFISTVGRFEPFLVIGGVFVAVTLVIVMDRPIRWFAASMLFIPFTVGVLHRLHFQRFIPNAFWRAALCTMIGTFPCMVVADAEMRALAIKKGTSRLIVEKSGVAAGLIANDAAPIFYIGFVGGTYVLYESATKSVVLTKQNDTAPLILRENPKRKGRTAYDGFNALLQTG